MGGQPRGTGGLGWEWGLRGIFREDGVGKRGSGSRARAELEGGRCGPEEAPPQGPGGRSEEGTWFGGEAGWGLSRGRAWPRATVQGQQWSGRCEPEEGRGPRSQDSHGAARFTDVAPGMTVLMAVGGPRAPTQRDPVCNYLGRYLAIPVSYKRQAKSCCFPTHGTGPSRGVVTVSLGLGGRHVVLEGQRSTSAQESAGLGETRPPLPRVPPSLGRRTRACVTAGAAVRQPMPDRVAAA